MTLRLVLFSIASGGLYLLFAARRPAPETAEFWAIWAGLFLLYGLAIRASSKASGGFVVGVILVASALSGRQSKREKRPSPTQRRSGGGPLRVEANPTSPARHDTHLAKKRFAR